MGGERTGSSWLGILSILAACRKDWGLFRTANGRIYTLSKRPIGPKDRRPRTLVA